MCRRLLAAGAVLPLAVAVGLAGGAWAQPAAPAAASAVGYPNNPQGTPQAQAGGAPVATDTAACPAAGRCAASPDVSRAADSGTTGTLQSGGVRTPSTAYPDSPVKTPAADPSGQAPKP